MMKKYATLLMTGMMLLALCACRSVGVPDEPGKEQDIMRFKNDRDDFKTNLLVKGPSPQSYDEETPPEGVTEVTYQSGEYALKAWLSDDPSDGKRHPAVVYVHGGFAFGLSDWEDVKAYLSAGFVLMTPMLRGENDNPGYFEGFYGEVDDVIAAGEFLKQQSYVDADRIYLSGHSSGGTISMLCSMLPSPYKAVATFGASPDQKEFWEAWADIAPFDVEDESETDIRSPLKYIDSIQKPLFVYVAREDVGYHILSEQLVETAAEYGKDCEFISMKGDHWSALQPSIAESIMKFQE